MSDLKKSFFLFECSSVIGAFSLLVRYIGKLREYIIVYGNNMFTNFLVCSFI